MNRTDLTRRRFLRGFGTATVTVTAGCSTGADSSERDVVAGPGGRPVFEPAALTIDVDDAVTWYFDSAGHNVSARPEDSELVRLPEGAEPFATYGPDESALSIVTVGETYERRFEVPGEYRYVCVPHVSDGMVGRIVVEG